jgi:hypothetical protein
MNIPYVGQVGTGAQEHGNDCGAACAAMVIKYATGSTPTVDQLYNEINPKNDTYLSVGGLMSVLEKRDIDVDWDAGVSTNKLKEYIDTGYPCIALIKYGALAGIRPNKFTGSHFVVVTAVDDYYVTIHDPLNTPTTGENIRVPRVMWDKCWTGLADQNPDRGLIICSVKNPITSPGGSPLPEPISEYVTVLTALKVRLEPNTNLPEIGAVKKNMRLKKAGPVLPGTGTVKGWQPVIVYLGTGVYGEKEPYLK